MPSSPPLPCALVGKAIYHASNRAFPIYSWSRMVSYRLDIKKKREKREKEILLVT